MSLSTKQKITSNQSNISTLQSDVQTLTNNVAAAVAFHNVLIENEDITSLINRIDTNLVSIGTLNTQTTEQAAQISNLQTQISSNDSEITSLTQGFHNDIAALNAQLVQDIGDVNTLIVQKESETTAKIQVETDARVNAINQVQQSVTDEVNLRNTQKAELDGRIETEETTRESADVLLGQRITDEEGARASAISSEALARSDEDAALDAKISLKEDALVFPNIDLNTANGFSSVLYKNGAELSVRTGNKNHLHLEGEGITLNDFPFSTGAGSPSNAEFGTYVGAAFLTRWYYSYSKVNALGEPANPTGDPGSIKFQLYEDGAAQDCYLMFDAINGMGGGLRYFTGSFVDSNNTQLNSVFYNSLSPVSNYVNKPFSFKCVEITNLDEPTTRHRLTIQYEFQSN